VSGFDPVFEGRTIAQKLGLSGDTSFPLTDTYSNFGYVLLSLVVENVTGLSFQNYLKQRVLAPLGIDGQVWAGATLRSGRRSTELTYDAAASAKRAGRITVVSGTAGRGSSPMRGGPARRQTPSREPSRGRPAALIGVSRIGWAGSRRRGRVVRHPVRR
jgi:CubicO group peptidase (beta-lactamase class C family)